MKLEKSYVIDGVIVEFETKFADIEVYARFGEDDDFRYFVKDGKVVATQYIEVDCGQNVGYVVDATVKGVK